MPKMLIDLTDEQDRKVDIFRAKNRLNSKAEAVTKLIDMCRV
jgi:hypothetical protein